MQDETALYGAKMMQPVMTPADNEENNLRPQHLEDYIGQEKAKQNLLRKWFSWWAAPRTFPAWHTA